MLKFGQKLKIIRKTKMIKSKS